MIQGGSTEAESISLPGPFAEVLMAMPATWTLCSALCHRLQQVGKLESHWKILMVCCEGLIWAGHTPGFLVSQHGSLVKTCYCQMCFSQVIHPSLAVTGPVDTQPTLATSLGLCFLGTKSDVPSECNFVQTSEFASDHWHLEECHHRGRTSFGMSASTELCLRGKVGKLEDALWGNHSIPTSWKDSCMISSIFS